ncbi:MAG: hypothetical protein PHW59_00275 [Desulfobacterales bacterium]|nr:hypothetical protein [Desulfobacterales bacterium]
MVKASGKKALISTCQSASKNSRSEMFYPDVKSLLSARFQKIRRWPKYSVVSALIRFIKIECRPFQKQGVLRNRLI